MREALPGFLEAGCRWAPSLGHLGVTWCESSCWLVKKKQKNKRKGIQVRWKVLLLAVWRLIWDQRCLSPLQLWLTPPLTGSDLRSALSSPHFQNVSFIFCSSCVSQTVLTAWKRPSCILFITIKTNEVVFLKSSLNMWDCRSERRQRWEKAHRLDFTPQRRLERQLSRQRREQKKSAQ